MAYDLHLVRTSDWLEAAEAPVTKADVDALILSDAELSWSADYIDMKVDGEIDVPPFSVALGFGVRGLI